MIEMQIVRTKIVDELKRAGLSGRGSTWRLIGEGVQWVVSIERLPFGSRLGVDVGLDLQTETKPSRANDCAIVIPFEGLPIVEYSDAMRAFDLESTLDWETRLRYLEQEISALGEYLAERSTFEAVRAAYRADEFEHGFVHKDARARLESESV